MVEPLRKKTMTLSELQLRTLTVLRRMVKQLNRAAYESGKSDSEFIDEVLDPFATDIRTDRCILRNK